MVYKIQVYNSRGFNRLMNVNNCPYRFDYTSHTKRYDYRVDIVFNNNSTERIMIINLHLVMVELVIYVSTMYEYNSIKSMFFIIDKEYEKLKDGQPY
jgi:hypothetical protein